MSRGLIVSAETLHAHQRDLLTEVFRAPLFNFYGSREVQNIGAMCRAERMHQVADWVHVDFTPDPGLPAPRIVVTPLECLSMPLIRYVNGDLGGGTDELCVCGLPFPLIDINVARVVDVFVTPEGTRIYGQFFTHLMYGIAGLRRFQFHQLATDLIKLRVVKDTVFDHATARKLQEVVEQIHRKASPAIHVDIEYVDDIPRTPAGKHIFTRSEVWSQRPGAAG